VDATTTSPGSSPSSPALLFFLIFQRALTRGITAGAIK
jgi:ABC-type glycerol-3-phosphate transport system permease component